MRRTLTALGAVVHRHRTPLVVAAVAALWFLPAVWWGIPRAGAAVPRPWGPDELAPWGVRAFLDAVRGGRNTMSPQYPLFHYWLLGAIAWIGDTVVSLANHAGLAPRSTTPGSDTLLMRLPSVLMAAGTVAAVWSATVRLTRDRAAALLAATATATIGPLVYYARTSNVDAPSLFWVALALVPAADALREGLTMRRAILCGICAGLGTATKDQQYAVFAALGLALLVAHLSDARRGGAAPAWRVLGAGCATGLLVWAVAGGILVMPGWFTEHVRFILHGGNADEPEAIRQLAGFYGSAPATPLGYLLVLARSVRLALAALGPVLILLALLGVARAWRADRRLLLLLLVPLFLLAGVILPVRFVLPRFLLPVELIACVLAGAALAGVGPRWRRAAGTAAVAGIAWSGLRAVDLTWQMLGDARYAAGAWLERNVVPGDSVGYYGARLKLPAIPGGTTLVLAPWRVRTIVDTATARYPQFIVTAPQQMHELEHEWAVPDSVFRRLVDGTLGYAEVFAHQTRGLVTRPLQVAAFVNPPVRIFARRDIVSRLPGPVRRELAAPAASR